MQKKNKRVLVVDDDQSCLEYAKNVLEREYEVDTAMTIQEAVKALVESQYDGVVLDINLSQDKTGNYIAYLLNHEDRYKDTVVIALSAHPMPTNMESYQEKGFDFYLMKPCPASRLLRCMSHHLQKVA